MPRATSRTSTAEPSRAALVPPKPAAPPVPAPPTPSAQIDALTGDPDFMTSLARGLAVIQAFSQKKRQLTISQVSAKTGFSRRSEERRVGKECRP